MHRLSEDGAPLAQATTGERPLTWATGDWVPLVWATSWGPLVWAKGSRGWATVPLAWFTGGRGQATAGISDTRGGHGQPPLGVYEQAPPLTPVTSESSKEEGTATKHHPLWLSVAWECTHPAAATAKDSWHHLHLPDHCHFPGPCN